jgi:hypothetical protein
MSLDKINVTLYDLLGYVLPGFIVLFAGSIVEATFFHSHLFYLAKLIKNPVLIVILAYFIGQILHATASGLKQRLRRQFTDENNRLSTPLYERVKEELRDFYDLPGEGDNPAQMSTLDTYMLTEAYMAISGGYLDRDVYMAREGFSKSTMVAMTLLALTFAACALHGDTVLRLQETPNSVARLSWYGSAIAALLAFGAALVFRRQFLFFSRIKNNYTMLTFLANRQKETKLIEAQMVAAVPAPIPDAAPPSVEEACKPANSFWSRLLTVFTHSS